jgi:hypothetical protein
MCNLMNNNRTSGFVSAVKNPKILRGAANGRKNQNVISYLNSNQGRPSVSGRSSIQAIVNGGRHSTSRGLFCIDYSVTFSVQIA